MNTETTLYHIQRYVETNEWFSSEIFDVSAEVFYITGRLLGRFEIHLTVVTPDQKEHARKLSVHEPYEYEVSSDGKMGQIKYKIDMLCQDIYIDIMNSKKYQEDVGGCVYIVEESNEGVDVTCVYCGESLTSEELIEQQYPYTDPVTMTEAEFTIPRPQPMNHYTWVSTLTDGQKQILKLHVITSLQKRCDTTYHI